MKKKILLSLLVSLAVIPSISCASFNNLNSPNPNNYEEVGAKNSSLDPTKYGAAAIETAYSSKRLVSTSATANGLEVNIKTYYSLPETQKTASNKAIIYVCNTDEYRKGLEDDVAIVGDFLKDYLVVVFDFKDSKFAFGKHLSKAVIELYCNMYNSKSYLGGVTVNKERMFILPAGHRIATDIPFFDVLASGAKGDKEYIVDTWNSYEKKIGSTYWKKATTIEDITMKNGEKLTLKDDGWGKYTTYKMNISYASKPAKPGPVLINACTSNKYRTIALVNTSSTSRIMSAELLLSGYTMVIQDHQYIPYMFDNGNGGSYGHMELGTYGGNNYSMAFYDNVKFQTAGVRAIKYYADEYGYSKTDIGGYGHSKASPISLLSIENPETVPEKKVYPQLDGHHYCDKARQNSPLFPNASIAEGTYKLGETYGPQPFLTYKNGDAIDSNIICVYHSMGYGSEDYEYITSKATKPTMIGCGKSDDRNAWSYFGPETEAYVAANIPFLTAGMENFGHTYPEDAEDPDYVMNYEETFVQFFDHYLKHKDIRVNYTSIRKNGQIASTDPLFIQFIGSATPESVESNIKVFDSSNVQVQGTWTKTRGDTRFTFATGSLVRGNTYTLVIGKDVTDENNHTIGFTSRQTFVY